MPTRGGSRGSSARSSPRERVVDADLAHGREGVRVRPAGGRSARASRARLLDLGRQRQQQWPRSSGGPRAGRRAAGRRRRRGRGTTTAGWPVVFQTAGEGIDARPSRAACAARPGPPTPRRRPGGRVVRASAARRASSKSSLMRAAWRASSRSARSSSAPRHQAAHAREAARAALQALRAAPRARRPGGSPRGSAAMQRVRARRRRGPARRPRGRASAARRPATRPPPRTSPSTGAGGTGGLSERAIRSFRRGGRDGGGLGVGRRSGGRSAATSSSSAVSATVRVRKPAHAQPVPVLVDAGMSEMRPRWGFSPNSPQLAAGMRIEPAPSEAVAAAHRPAATAAALPPLEPPGVRSVSQGLRVMPEGGALGGADDRQLGQVRLAEDHRARRAQPPHEARRRARPGRRERAVPWVVTSPATSVVVLDRDRHAEQRPLVAGAAARVGLVGLGERALGDDHAEGVQLGVEPLDPLQVELDQLARGDLAAAHQLAPGAATPAKARSSRSMRAV